MLDDHINDPDQEYEDREFVHAMHGSYAEICGSGWVFLSEKVTCYLAQLEILFYSVFLSTLSRSVMIFIFHIPIVHNTLYDHEFNPNCLLFCLYS